MSLTPDSSGFIATAQQALASGWRSLTGLFVHTHALAGPSLQTVAALEPRFAPQVPMSAENLDAGLLLKLSGQGYKRGKEVTAATHPELYNDFIAMCARAGLPHPPQLVIAESARPNAADMPDEHAIVMTTGLMQMLSFRELKAVLGHELGHASSDHTTPRIKAMALCSGAGAVVGNAVAHHGGIVGRFIDHDVANPSWLRRTATWVFGRANQPLSVLPSLAYIVAGATLGLGIANKLAVGPTELDADHKGAHISGDPEALASALQKLDIARKAHVGTVKDKIESTIKREFSGYPTMQTRIERLQGLPATVQAAPPSTHAAAAPITSVTDAQHIAMPTQAATAQL